MPKPELIPELPIAYRWGGPRPFTDPIDMDFVLRELEPSLRNQVIAAKFENVAAVHRTLADGAAKIAGLLSGGKRGT